MLLKIIQLFSEINYVKKHVVQQIEKLYLIPIKSKKSYSNLFKSKAPSITKMTPLYFISVPTSREFLLFGVVLI